MNGYRRTQRTSARRRLWWLGAVLLAALLLSAVATERYLATSDFSPEGCPVLNLEPHHGLLVVAPHCDDETSGAGGLIQAALCEGLDVRVVIVTAGDSYRRAAMAQFHRPLLKPTDFVALGERRQLESLEALERLVPDHSESCPQSAPA